MLSPSQAAMAASPVAVKLTYVNETGAGAARGNAPVSLFQPIWMAGIAGAAIAAIAAGQASGPAAGRKSRLNARFIQAAMGVVIAVPCGYGMERLADAMLKLDVPDLAGMGAFISLAILALFLMISAVLSWTGLRGIVLFVVLMFFGAPLLSLPPEFMTAFTGIGFIRGCRCASWSKGCESSFSSAEASAGTARRPRWRRSERAV